MTTIVNEHSTAYRFALETDRLRFRYGLADTYLVRAAQPGEYEHVLERCQSTPAALRVHLQTKPPEFPATVVARRSWASADIKRYLVGGHLNLAKSILHDATKEDRGDNWFRHIEALPSNARGIQGIIADVIYLSNEAETANGNVTLALHLFRQLEEADRLSRGTPCHTSIRRRPPWRSLGASKAFR